MTAIPDPSAISGIHTPVFAKVPDPARLFDRRAERLHHLAQSSRLGPYLDFLADLSSVQASIVRDLPAPPALDPAAVERNRSYRMPPVDRAQLVSTDAMDETLSQILERADGIDMPPPARAALDSLRNAPASDRNTLLADLAHDRVDDGLAAPATFAAAALQVLAARTAATLDPDQLVPIRTGICPSCGGKPSVSKVTATQNLEGARYACCATCATEWNEVRLTCLSCGSTKGLSYRTLEEAARPAIQAETCSECHSWVKILYHNRDTTLDPMADDIASLGLDAQMRETEWSRAGFNPFLIGY